jgi:hypothetical protein
MVTAIHCTYLQLAFLLVLCLRLCLGLLQHKEDGEWIVNGAWYKSLQHKQVGTILLDTPAPCASWSSWWRRCPSVKQNRVSEGAVVRWALSILLAPATRTGLACTCNTNRLACTCNTNRLACTCLHLLAPACTCLHLLAPACTCLHNAPCASPPPAPSSSWRTPWPSPSAPSPGRGQPAPTCAVDRVTCGGGARGTCGALLLSGSPG